MPRRLRRTKIVAMLGPAADRDSNLEKATATGANVVRMSLSHGSPEDHKTRADRVRKIAAKPGRHVVTLGDLQGLKIRVPTFKEGKILFNTGDKFLLGANLGKGEGDKRKVDIDYKDPPADVVPGDVLLLDGDRVQLKALEVQGMKVFTEVIVGSSLSNNKGIDKPGGGLSVEALTEKDKADTGTVALVGVDYLVVSLPRCGEDLNYVRCLARDVGCDVRIVTKAGRAEAVCSQEAVDNITLAPDVAMVARGDLGVEIGDPELVDTQKTLIRRARQLSRTVIMATQMMELIVTSPMPTRAEAMDIASAIPGGTDAVTLSAGTAAGQYPLETAAAMACTCLGAGKIPSINISKHRLDVQFDNAEGAIAMLVIYVANYLKDVAVIITIIESDRTTLMTSCISSGPPIFVMSCHEYTLNLTVLYRGATPVYLNSANGDVAAASEAVNLLRDKGYLISGDLVIVTQGDVMSAVGLTNITHILAAE